MKIGTITQVSGPVVDVEFEAGHLPKIKEALSVELNGQTRVMGRPLHHAGGQRGSGPGHEGDRSRQDH